MENNDRPPLTTITESGVYRLKLTLPKPEKVFVRDDGSVSCRLFFVAADGKCLSRFYGTINPSSLAMLVGKLSGKWTDNIRGDATVMEFLEYLKPACGKPTDIGVEVTESQNINPKTGTPYLNYKLTFPKGSQKPAAPTSQPPGDDSVPF